MKRKIFFIALLSIIAIHSKYPFASNWYSSTFRIDSSSPEYILAQECGDEDVSDSKIRMKRFSIILGEMEKKCYCSKEDIASKILWGYDILTKDLKKDLPLLTFAEGLNGYLPLGTRDNLDARLTEYLSVIGQ